MAPVRVYGTRSAPVRHPSGTRSDPGLWHPFGTRPAPVRIRVYGTRSALLAGDYLFGSISLCSTTETI